MVIMTRSLSRLARLGLMSLSVSIAACQSVGDRNESMMPSNQNQQQGQRANDDIQRGQAPAGDRLESARIRTELAFNYFQRGQLSIALEEIRSALANIWRCSSSITCCGSPSRKRSALSTSSA